MRTIDFTLIFLLTVLAIGSSSIDLVLAQESANGPQITLTAENEPLGDILETVSQDTGYRFNLASEWKDYPVSTSIVKLPLERGLKRLLRNLNYTVIWESDKIITIKIIGKVDPKISRPDTSPPPSFPTYTEDTGPVMEPESVSAEQGEGSDPSLEEPQVNDGVEEPANVETGNDEPTPQEGGQDEPVENDPNETDVPAVDASPASS